MNLLVLVIIDVKVNSLLYFAGVERNVLGFPDMISIFGHLSRCSANQVQLYPHTLYSVVVSRYD